MFIGEVKDVGACDNRRRLFFRPFSFYLILKYLRKFGEEAERDRQLLTPLFSLEASECEASASDLRRVGSIWMKFDNKKMSEQCLTDIFPDIKFYTYDTYDYEIDSFSSCMFIPINRYANLSEFELIIHELMIKIEEHLISETEASLTKPSSQYDLPIRKPSAFDWFPLPCKIQGGKKNSCNSFESQSRYIMDVSTWICNNHHKNSP